MSLVPKALRGKIEALLCLIVPLYNINEDGSISTNNFSLEMYKGALVQLLDLSSSGLTRPDFEICAWNAIHKTIKSQSRSCSDYEKFLTLEIDELKKKRPSKFTACSRCHFTLPQDYDIEFKIWGANINISNFPPTGLSDEQPLLRDGRTALKSPDFGAYLTTTVYERTKSGALERASSDIAFLLGILNFTLNLGSLKWFISSAEKDPAAKLFPGREIFLLNKHSIADTDIWRYYTVYPKKTAMLNDREFDKIKQYPKMLERLKSIKPSDRSFYRSFFELYFDAITEVDSDIVVMRLWKAAEHITMAQSAHHIANRLAITWDDKEAVSAVCYALGQRRNWIMHNANPSPRADELPPLFQHLLEKSAWKSLSKDVKNLSHWKTILQISDMSIDLDMAEDAISILRSLK